MKRGFFIVFAVTLFIQVAGAQTIKTGVLVIGNGNNSIGAGIQSAVSGVKTVLLLSEQSFELSPLKQNLSSGVEQAFLKKIRILKGVKDSTITVDFDNAIANSALRSWMDSTKNLTVIKGASWLKLKRAGSRWNVELSDGRTIKAGVLINADKSGKVEAALQIQKADQLWQPFTYENNLYRTALAAGYAITNTTANVLSLYRLLISNQENLITLDAMHESMGAGQAAGATAAYAEFFKLKTSQSNLKKIQGELINYKLSVVPFADIHNTDNNWKDIQFMGLSGFLKAEGSNGAAYFRPDKQVLTEEIKEPVKAYYYKAQIWFDDHKDIEMTIGSTLDLVCTVGNKSLENTQAEIKKKWKSVYKFNTELDLKRGITRREFAVLVNEYLKPFDVNVDKTGRVVR